MRCDLAAGLTFAVSTALASPTAHGPESAKLRTRNIVDKTADSYDFVVVGGGLAGLVLGARLSEDANHTVLVLEAGGNGDEYRDRIDVPGNAYYKSLWPTPLNWDFHTVPQVSANNTKCEWPRGKVLGGSSAINGLYMNRPGKIEVDAWQEMLGNMDGSDNWGWDSFFAAMKKSETFSPPSDEIAKEAGITWNAASHGTKGPIHMSWPGYTFPIVGQWSTAAQGAGVATSKDTYGGENWGAYVATSAINPANWTRSYSRTGYLDPLEARKNYDVLVNAHVTRILFSSSSSKGNMTANAVEYTTDNGATLSTVKVNKEVILAGGTIGSPTVLLHSGIGPKDVLAAAGVKLISELPGVGQHLQDHVSVSLQWDTNQPTAGSVYADDASKKNDPAYLSYINSAVAYINASVLFGSSAGTVQSTTSGQIDAYVPKGSSDSTVKAGYKAIYNTTASKILRSPLGLAELLIGNNVDGAIRIGAALQHPFSHGSITISSSDPMQYPVIDPGYLNHPTDVQVLREALKLIRRIGQTEPLKSSMTNEVLPGSQVQSDAQWEDWLRGQVFTEFHPSSTCAMLPLEQGGVVDANLRVYGLANVRVADASVPPMAFSAHLMSSTYGIAEQASTIIRNYHNQKSPSNSASQTPASSSSQNGSGNGGSSSKSGSGSNKTNGASYMRCAIPLHIVSSLVFMTLRCFI